MKLYHAWYKTQEYEEEHDIWIDINHHSDCIVVIADSYFEALLKVEECLLAITKDGYRAVLDSNIKECIGLDVWHGFNYTNINPIFNE